MKQLAAAEKLSKSYWNARRFSNTQSTKKLRCLLTGTSVAFES